VSYGGKEMYQAPNGPYSVFAGRDASRALAKMSFDPADLNSSNISDLTEDELKVMKDWEAKFLNTKKYPVVGKLID
jgi:membrane-associated progesterone receptor component